MVGLPGTSEGTGATIAKATTQSSQTAAEVDLLVTDAGEPSGRWRLRNWRLPVKFAALLLVPLTVAMVLGGLRIAGAVDDAGRLGEAQRQATVAAAAAAVTQELQHERDRLAAYVVTRSAAARTAWQEQVVAVDAAVGRLRDAAPEGADPSSDAAMAYDAAVRQLGALPDLRAEVGDDPDQVAAIAIARYGDRIAALITVTRTGLAAADPAQRALVEAVEALAEAKEEVSTQHATLLAALLGQAILDAQEDELRESATRYESATTRFRATGDDQAAADYAATVPGPLVTDYGRLLNQVLTGGGATLIPAERWDAAAGGTTDLLRAVERTQLDRLVAEAGQLRDDARTAAIRDAVLVAVLILLTLAVLVAVARSVLRPLGVLRTAAFDIATHQLPAEIARLQEPGGSGGDTRVEPVPVHTREDVGELARAFDAVHQEAVRLAAEQASLRAGVDDMFVNLSRRSQSLVERQLALIDRLESAERDPDQLEQLFGLDHLATRMRRNNENLLVLAGMGLRQRSGEPVPVYDVLRAAAGEIADYRRVSVRPAAGIAVRASVVDDLVHLLAELLDNATAFSPPDAIVELSASQREDRLLIEIADSGVGLAEERRAEINRTLAEPPSLTAAVGRTMGLYVVGRLASRHGIEVRLVAPSVGEGITAAVVVPETALAALVETVREREPAAPAPSSSASESSSTVSDLFAPAVPVTPAADDALFGTLPAGQLVEVASPIFDDMVSAWFQARRPPPGSPGRAGRTRTPEPQWQSPADDGWLAAEVAVPANGVAGRTPAGLPRRRPGALLVPGAVDAAPVAVGAARDPDALRTRLSGFQRGAREGRHTGQGRHARSGEEAP